MSESKAIPELNSFWVSIRREFCSGATASEGTTLQETELQALRLAVARGKYLPDPMAIAEKMIKIGNPSGSTL